MPLLVCLCLHLRLFLTLLVCCFRCASEEESTGRKKVKSRSANIGTGTMNGEKPENARTAGEREDDDPFESDDEAERAANRQRTA